MPDDAYASQSPYRNTNSRHLCDGWRYMLLSTCDFWYFSIWTQVNKWTDNYFNVFMLTHSCARACADTNLHLRFSLWDAENFTARLSSHNLKFTPEKGFLARHRRFHHHFVLITFKNSKG